MTGSRDAWITGIGLVSSLGEGVETHWQRLRTAAAPVVDETRLAPFALHPLAEVDYAQQIPNRGDRRQMGPWQLLGTYSAGLALADAAIAPDDPLREAINLIVAGGVGERDRESDTAILTEEAYGTLSDARLNALMVDTLRPTLFLAQLSNLLAGNISIVHNVTGSSRTLMGEEGAGVSAVEHAVRRIAAGHDDIFLVGGAYVAECAEQLICLTVGHLAWQHAYAPVWSRAEQGGGLIPGSVGAFLVIESADHALARGARGHARIDEVASCRGTVSDAVGGLSRLPAAGPLLVLSGATGSEPQTTSERSALQALARGGAKPALRAVSSMLGHSLEASFPAGLALAAIAAGKGAAYDPFDASGIEAAFAGTPETVVVTSSGHWHGAGAALVSRIAD